MSDAATPNTEALQDALASFSHELYREHLEEASFLYAQHQTFVNDPQRLWPGVAMFEDRLVEHLRALEWCGQEVLDVCQAQLAQADEGELYAMTRIFCRHAKHELLLEALTTRASKPVFATAIIDGLCHEPAGSWQKPLMKSLLDGDPTLWPHAARWAGYAQLPVKSWLVSAVARADVEVAPLAWAAGQLRLTDAAPALIQRVETGEPPVRQAAARALLSIGHENVLQLLAQAASKPDGAWAWLPLALGAGGHVAEDLVAAAKGRVLDREQLLALGLTGHARAVEPLFTYLPHSELGPTAALGLWLITGAPLFDEQEVKEEVFKEELFDDELAKLEEAGSPAAAAGVTSGQKVRSLSTNPEAWKNWWNANGGRFRSDVRTRTGVPLAPARLLELVQADTTPREVRELCFEELRIRYNLGLIFSTDMLVADQQRIIAQAWDWARTNASTFHAGKWYFATRLV